MVASRVWQMTQIGSRLSTPGRKCLVWPRLVYPRWVAVPLALSACLVCVGQRGVVVISGQPVMLQTRISRDGRVLYP